MILHTRGILATRYPILYDEEGSGEYLLDIAGENLGKHQLVYRGNDEAWHLADADDASKVPVIGLTLEAIASSRRGRILLRGYVGDPAWSWTTGGLNGRVFASTVAGGLTQVQTAQCVGIAFFDHGLWFDPSGVGSSLSGSGSATVPVFSTYVTVTHGLAGTPDNIQVTPKDELGARDFWVSNVGALTFRINISMADLSDAHAFYWWGTV